MIKYYADLEQGSPEWLAARRGIITASEVKLLLTPTLKTADNDKSRAHVWELLSQRVSGYVEPKYVSDDMLRGREDEPDALEIYAENCDGKIEECGFITNDEWGFTLGYSPDALVGVDGLAEVKSRRQKYQVQTIVDGKVPDEYMLQLQTGLLVTKRLWIDFISYRDGLPLFVMRVYPDPVLQSAIIEAARATYAKIDALEAVYRENAAKYIMTQKKEELEIVL